MLGLGANFNWLSRIKHCTSSMLVDVWIYTPFVAILVLAGIRSLPKEPFEASDVDDAGWLYMFRRLMLPMMWPYILVAVIFRLMDCLKIFDIIYVLTAGGPGDATTTAGQRFQGFLTKLNYSRGSTYMFLLWVLVFIMARYLVGVLGKAQRRAAGAEGVMMAPRTDARPAGGSPPASVGAEVLTAGLVRLLAVPDPVDGAAVAEEQRPADQHVLLQFSPDADQFRYRARPARHRV